MIERRGPQRQETKDIPGCIFAVIFAAVLGLMLAATLYMASGR